MKVKGEGWGGGGWVVYAKIKDSLPANQGQGLI